MTTFNEADCLKTNPFEGDFGSPGDKVLKDKIGTARKGGTCGMCPARDCARRARAIAGRSV